MIKSIIEGCVLVATVRRWLMAEAITPLWVMWAESPARWTAEPICMSDEGVRISS